MDTVSSEKRSEIMRRVRQRNTGPEMVVRKLLHAIGYRFRLHRKGLPGSPDIVLPKYRAVIFVHGCFWHGHGCRKGRLPSTRRDFWRAKIDGNRSRDAKAEADLNALGYRVLVVWECKVKDKETLEIRLKTFLPKKNQHGQTFET